MSLDHNNSSTVVWFGKQQVLSMCRSQLHGHHLQTSKALHRSTCRANELLLMEEILHHLGCKNPVSNAIHYLLTGSGFLSSTVGWPLSLVFMAMSPFTFFCGLKVGRFSWQEAREWQEDVVPHWNWKVEDMVIVVSIIIIRIRHVISFLCTSR